MYCSSCGAPATPGLSYCNRCGTEVISKGKSPSDMPLESLVWAIVACAVIGIGSNIGLMALMKESLHLDYPLILAFSLIFFFPFLIAECVFIWLLLRSQRSPKEPRPVIQPPAVTTNELDAARPRVLQAPATSVTEHTTHSLEPARVDRNTQ